MYILIVSFYVALLGLVGMVYLKKREVISGRATLIARLGRGTDSFFDTIFTSVGQKISYINRHTFIVIGQLMAFHLLLRIRKIYVEIKHRTLQNPHGRKILDAVRGRAEVKNHGASLYLRRISSQSK